MRGLTIKQELFLTNKTTKRGKPYYDYTRHFKIRIDINGLYHAVNRKGEEIELTKRELELYNRESFLNPIVVKNGWLTFIGIMVLISLLLQILLLLGM